MHTFLAPLTRPPVPPTIQTSAERASIQTLRISSNVCKIAAVGFGWDRAFGFEGIPYNSNGLSHEESQDTVSEKHKRWIEVDDKSNIAPVWRAFEMF